MDVNKTLKLSYFHRYDFEMIDKAPVSRYNYDLVGIIYVGSEAVPQSDIRVRLYSDLYLIEEVIPLAQRTQEYKELMTTETYKSRLILK